MTLYDPPPLNAPIWQWREYLSELDPSKDQAEIARTEVFIQKITAPDFRLEDLLD